MKKTTFVLFSILTVSGGMQGSRNESALSQSVLERYAQFLEKLVLVNKTIIEKQSQIGQAYKQWYDDYKKILALEAYYKQKKEQVIVEDPQSKKPAEPLQSVSDESAKITVPILQLNGKDMGVSCSNGSRVGNLVRRGRGFKRYNNCRYFKKCDFKK